MKNEKVEELAKAIFLKNTNEKFYTVNTKKNLTSLIKGSLEIATLFYEILEEQNDKKSNDSTS